TDPEMLPGTAKGRTEVVRPFVRRLSVRRDDVHDLAAPPAAELHRTRREGEQRVVLAAAHVVARVEVGAPLAHEDLAGVDRLPAEALDAEALRVRVATVARGARALLVCHDGPVSRSGCRGRPRGPAGGLLDGGDLEPGQLLPVTLAHPVARLVL